MATMFGKTSTSHSHQCIVCSSAIPCDSPDDPQGCFVSALTCGICDDAVNNFDGDVDNYEELVDDLADKVGYEDILQDNDFRDEEFSQVVPLGQGRTRRRS